MRYLLIIYITILVYSCTNEKNNLPVVNENLKQKVLVDNFNSAIELYSKSNQNYNIDKLKFYKDEFTKLFEYSFELSENKDKELIKNIEISIDTIKSSIKKRYYLYDNHSEIILNQIDILKEIANKSNKENISNDFRNKVLSSSQSILMYHYKNMIGPVINMRAFMLRSEPYSSKIIKGNKLKAKIDFLAYSKYSEPEIFFCKSLEPKSYEPIDIIDTIEYNELETYLEYTPDSIGVFEHYLVFKVKTLDESVISNWIDTINYTVTRK